jgi:hypothetical protein
MRKRVRQTIITQQYSVQLAFLRNAGLPAELCRLDAFRAELLPLITPPAQDAPPAPARRDGGRRPLTFTRFADIDPAPRKVYLVAGLLGAGEASSFVGAPGSGKSDLAGDVGCHISAGLPWLGRRVTRGAVLYVAAERVKLTERRFAAFKNHHRIDNLPLAIVSGPVNMLSSQEHVHEIAELAALLTKKPGCPSC